MLASVLLLLSTAFAAPKITVRATVNDDLRSISGTLHAEDLPGAEWRDTLIDLPSAHGDVDASRMWPASPQQGQVTWTQDGDTLTFEAKLPHRWGDIGWSRHRLFANGGWYPVALVDGALPVVDWDVALTLPEGVVGVVGSSLGTDTVRWKASGERASMAAIRDATILHLEGEGFDVQVLTRKRPRPAIRKTLPEQLAFMAVDDHVWRGVIVEGPLRLQLARPGVGVAYLSDLAYEVFPGFSRLHADSVAGSIAAAFAPSPEPLTRAVTGAAMGYRQRVAVGSEQQRDAIYNARWLSIVDNALLASDMRFKDAILQEPAPTRPIPDDLAVRFRPHVPAGVAVGQVRARLGNAAAIELAESLARGATLTEATEQIGMVDDPWRVWAGRYPLQDYMVSRRKGVATVVRDAPPEAPAEVVVVVADGRRILWDVPEGPAEMIVAMPDVKEVVIDPDRLVGQTTRANDVVPQPIWATAGILIGRIDFLVPFVEVDLSFQLRRSGDTHNRWLVGAFSNQRDRFGARVGWTALAGRPTLRTVREHAFGISFEASYLNPLFDDVRGARVSLGGSFQWDWDNRETLMFPRRGASLRVRLDGGGAPEGGNDYIRATAITTGTFSPHPRVVVGMRVVAGFARAQSPARRLIFGGYDGVRGLPDQLVQPGAQGILSLEVRPVLFDNANVPLGVGTMTTMYAIAGVDVGAASVNNDAVLAVGANAGLGMVFSVLGITPGSLHLNVGVPVLTSGLDRSEEIYPVTFIASWGVPF